MALYLSQFASLNAALSAWSLAGGRLVIDQDVITTDTFVTGNGVFWPDKGYVLETDGVRTITYNGPNTLEFLRFYQETGRTELLIRGPLTIDCQGKASTGLWIDNQVVSGADRRDVTIDGLRVENCKLHTNHSGGANGIRFSGGADTLSIRNWSVSNITRGAGTGQAGSYGTTGIAIGGSSTTDSNPRRILIENFSVNDISTEDAPGTAAYGDCDGLLLFQYKVGDDDVVAPIIRNGVVKNAIGRAIKRYATAFGGVTENITIIRSVQGVNTGSTDLAHQDGGGTIRNIKFIYSDDAHVTPTKPIGMALGISADPGHGLIENISIDDTTGAVKACLVQPYYNYGDATPRAYTIRNVKDTGRSETIFLSGALGAFGRASIILENIDCELTQSVCRTDDHIVHMAVTGSQLLNRGADVPAVRMLGGSVKPDRWGLWLGDETLKGFARYTGLGYNNPTYSNGFSGPGGGVEATPEPGRSEMAGRVVLPIARLAPGATWHGPAAGQYQAVGGDYVARLTGLRNTFGYGEAETSPGGTAWTSIKSPPTGVAFVNGGAPTGVGSNLEVWKDGTTQAVRVTNQTGAEAIFQIILNP